MSFQSLVSLVSSQTVKGRLSLLGLLTLVAAIPVTVFVAQQQQLLEQQALFGFSGPGGSSSGGAPTASLAIISGSSPVAPGGSITFRGSAQGTRLTGMQLFFIKTTADFTKRTSFRPIATQSCSGSSCTITGTFRPSLAELGDVIVVVNAYSDSNGNGQESDVGESCSGNPRYTTPGWSRCGSNDNIQVTVRLDSPGYSQASYGTYSQATYGGPQGRPPQASVTANGIGPTSGQQINVRAGETVRIDAESVGTGLIGMDVLYAKVDADLKQGSSWSPAIGNITNCGGSESCQRSANWNTSGVAPGRYFLAINAYSDWNPRDGRTTDPQERCSGNPDTGAPAFTSGGFVDCGPNDLLVVNILQPPQNNRPAVLDVGGGTGIASPCRLVSFRGIHFFHCDVAARDPNVCDLDGDGICEPPQGTDCDGDNDGLSECTGEDPILDVKPGVEKVVNFNCSTFGKPCENPDKTPQVKAARTEIGTAYESFFIPRDACIVEFSVVDGGGLVSETEVVNLCR